MTLTALVLVLVPWPQNHVRRWLNVPRAIPHHMKSILITGAAGQDYRTTIYGAYRLSQPNKRGVDVKWIEPED